MHYTVERIWGKHAAEHNTADRMVYGFEYLISKIIWRWRLGYKHVIQTFCQEISFTPIYLRSLLYINQNKYRFANKTKQARPSI